MPSLFSRLFLSIALIASLGMLSTACGSSDSGSTSSSTAASKATTSTPNTTAAAGGGANATGDKTLAGTVGPGFEIMLVDSAGADVTTLPAGTYTVNVDDTSDIHNFHLTGPGVDEMTEVSEIGKKTWTIKLQPGEYTFQCDPHSSSMNGSFTVT